jgi:hypothetical protein
MDTFGPLLPGDFQYQGKAQPLDTSQEIATDAWHPVYPDRVLRRRLPQAAMPTFAIDGFPRPPATQLLAFTCYPDRIDRQRMLAHLQSYDGRHNIFPINDPTPPPLLLTEDKIRLPHLAPDIGNNALLGGWNF